jgi:hypothetical protein
MTPDFMAALGCSRRLKAVPPQSRNNVSIPKTG